MGRNVFSAVLAVVFLFGLALRCAPITERRLDEGANELGDSRWIVDDPGTALHLRRIELALAEGRVPTHDPFQGHGASPEIPALPVFDALMAGFAQRWLASAEGDPALGGVDEADLEAFAAGVGPVAYVLAFAALVAALWVAARGARSAVLLAALGFACAPAAITAGEVGRLDAAAFALVLLALLVRSTQVAVRAEDALATILEALLAGVVAGLLASISAAGPFLALPTAAAFFARACRGPVPVRPIATRAGLLFTLVAAFTARLPLADGPWESLPGGLLARWTLAASDLLLVSAAPFALLLLTAPRDGNRQGLAFARIAALAAMLALLVFEAPRAWSAASGPITAWWQAREVVGADATIALDHLLGLSLVTASGLVVGVVRLARMPDAAGLHLALASVVTFGLAILEPATASLCVATSAVALAGGLPLLASERARLAWLVVVGGGAAFVAYASSGLGSASRRVPVPEQLDRFTALRWIRDAVPAGGPFNSSSAKSTWGILADPSEGELVAYHARRPVLASYSAAFSQPESVVEARRLSREAPGAEIVERMRVHGLRLAVASYRHEGILGSVGRDATWAGGIPLPGAERLLPRDLPPTPSGSRTTIPIVWSLEIPATSRGPSSLVPR